MALTFRREENHMTNDDFEKQARLIADSQERFLETVRNLSQLVDSLIKHQSSFMSYLNTWRDLFVSSRDLMQEHLELHKQSLEALKSVSRALAESSVNANENHERIEKLMIKIESYFGSGEGLEYDN
jgi:hypothetical protein